MTTADEYGGAAEPPLAPDLNELSDKDLERVVARVCSTYGKVVRVAVHAAHTNPGVRPFALVDMSAVNEAERLAAAFRRPRMGSAVLLLLEPRTADLLLTSPFNLAGEGARPR